MQLLQDLLEAALELRLVPPDQVLLLLPLRPLAVVLVGQLHSEDVQVLPHLAGGGGTTGRTSSQAGFTPTNYTATSSRSLYLSLPVLDVSHGHVSLLLHGGDLVLQRQTLGLLRLLLHPRHLLLQLRQLVSPLLLLVQLLLGELAQLSAALVQLVVQPTGGSRESGQHTQRAL